MAKKLSSRNPERISHSVHMTADVDKLLLAKRRELKMDNWSEVIRWCIETALATKDTSAVDRHRLAHLADVCKKQNAEIRQLKEELRGYRITLQFAHAQMMKAVAKVSSRLEVDKEAS